MCVHQAGLEGLRLLVREQAATIEAKAATIEGQAATIETLRVEQVHSAIYMHARVCTQSKSAPPNLSDGAQGEAGRG